MFHFLKVFTYQDMAQLILQNSIQDFKKFNIMNFKLKLKQGGEIQFKRIK